MNEAWMDECAVRLQPLVDQYKPRQHQTFVTEKLRDLIVTNPIMSWGQKIFSNLFLVPYLENYKRKKYLYLGFLGIQDTQYTLMDSLFP